MRDVKFVTSNLQSARPCVHFLSGHRNLCRGQGTCLHIHTHMHTCTHKHTNCRWVLSDKMNNLGGFVISSWWQFNIFMCRATWEVLSQHAWLEVLRLEVVL